MAVKVEKWKTIDCKLFETEADALEHEAFLQFAKVIESIVDGNDGVVMNEKEANDLALALWNNGEKLLPFFKRFE
jgi:hypothetical protein